MAAHGDTEKMQDLRVLILTVSIFVTGNFNVSLFLRRLSLRNVNSLECIVCECFMVIFPLFYRSENMSLQVSNCDSNDTQDSYISSPSIFSEPVLVLASHMIQKV